MAKTKYDVTDPTALRVIYELREMKDGDLVLLRGETGAVAGRSIVDEDAFFAFRWFDDGRAILGWRRRRL